MLLTLAVNGSAQASTFVYASNPAGAADYAGAILSAKLQAFIAFNSTYPGYGGFLPDFESNDTSIQPYQLNETAGGVFGRVQAADNG